MSEWKPIESAPRDQKVLVWGRIWSDWGDEGKGDPANWEPADYWIADAVYEGGVCYVDAGFGSGESAECCATHWQPLPEPPQ